MNLSTEHLMAVRAIFLSALLLSLLTPFLTSAQNAPGEEEWIQLFNGRDLTGWDIKIAGYELNENYKNTFLVEDGLLKVSYDEYESFNGEYGHLYYQTPFSHYKLRIEYRFVGEQTEGGAPWNVRNSGVMVHSQSAASVGKDQEFPVSLEVQFLGGLGQGPRPTANVCTPGTLVTVDGEVIQDHIVNSTSQTYDGDQWVTVEVVVLGDSVVHHIMEGDTVLTYTHPQIGGGFVSAQYDWEAGKVPDAEAWIKKAGTSLMEGYIALQAESHPIQFRRVELLNLKGCMDPESPHFKSYHQVPDEAQCE